MITPKCVRNGNPCDFHKSGKYIKWPCSHPYNQKERHDRFMLSKKKCEDCGNLCTTKFCRKCRGKHFKSHLLGKKLPKWWCDRISEGQGKGENNKHWKGENVDYWSKHKGLVKYYGNPIECNFCGVEGKKNKGGRWTIQWANKTGVYTRNIEDYIGLCTSCHSAFDGKTKNDDDYVHGSGGKYRRGCRCYLCKKHKSLYRNRLIGFKEIVK